MVLIEERNWNNNKTKNESQEGRESSGIPSWFGFLVIQFYGWKSHPEKSPVGKEVCCCKEEVFTRLKENERNSYDNDL